jgi:D-beta-D-heptose 7-phosphate kinase/D-beta-D-heptose 1-phosphate adenosyltransferase
MSRILVIGDLMVDNYLIGSCQRVSPEAPVQIVDIKDEKSVLGGAGNVVNNILSLGHHADILSVIGDCENTIKLRSLLVKSNISDEFLITEKDRKSSKKTRIIASKQQVVRYDSETVCDINTESETKLFELFSQLIDNYSVIILSDYGKGVLTNKLTKQIITLANQHNIKVLVDPKGSDYTKYTGAYLLTPNKTEAEKALGITIDLDNLAFATKALKDNHNLTKSIITLSENGIAIFDEHLRIHPTKAREVFDVSGAGDSVIAALAIKLMQSDDIDDAAEFANLVAGVVVAKIGTATATMDEVNAKQHHIKTREQIKIIAKNYQAQGKKIVFTNGCFDILHLGHIKYLEEAKKLGEVLIVGVNSDASVKRLKGETRPINPEFDRAYLLNALKSVDYTVIFSEDTPYELIKTIAPDVLVKGADYKDKEVIGSDIAKSTHLIEFTTGKSTTNIIKRIQDD